MPTGRTLSWDDIGRATEPRDFRVDDIVVTISAMNIENWQQNPSARYHVFGGIEGGRPVYALGTRAN